jgi:hypothetical protein
MEYWKTGKIETAEPECWNNGVMEYWVKGKKVMLPKPSVDEMRNHRSTLPE